MMMHNMTIAMGLPIGTCLKIRKIYLSCFMAVEAIICPRNIAANNEEAEEYVRVTRNGRIRNVLLILLWVGPIT